MPLKKTVAQAFLAKEHLQIKFYISKIEHFKKILKAFLVEGKKRRMVFKIPNF